MYKYKLNNSYTVYVNWAYLASQRIVKHWHARYQNWDLVLSQLEIMFADRAVG